MERKTVSAEILSSCMAPPPVVQEPTVLVDLNNSHGTNICRDQLRCSLTIYKLFRKTLLLHSFLRKVVNITLTSHINVSSVESLIVSDSATP